VKKNWKAPGTNGSGHLKRGLGIGVATWGGAGHDSTAKVTIHPDGSVEVEMGRRTSARAPARSSRWWRPRPSACSPSQVTVKIGRNAYPASGASGGSTTVGGVSTSTRKATTKALNVLLEKIAPMLGVPPDQLEAVDQRIQVKGNAAKGMTWKQAANKLGTISIEESDKSEQRRPDGMFSAGTGRRADG
jgi:xanthine dehydrogenase YagR molybdenum-binding subunit